MGAGEVTGMKQTRTQALFATFFKIGAFTFGGGYAMVALLEHEFVEEKQWVTREEFLDMVAIAESTPGPVAINSATYLGYHMAGFWGALVSTVAVVLPSFLIIFAISLVFDQFPAQRLPRWRCVCRLLRSSMPSHCSLTSFCSCRWCPARSGAFRCAWST